MSIDFVQKEQNKEKASSSYPLDCNTFNMLQECRHNSNPLPIFLQFLVKTPVEQTFNLELNIPDGVTLSEAAGDRLSVVVGSLVFP